MADSYVNTRRLSVRTMPGGRSTVELSPYPALTASAVAKPPLSLLLGRDVHRLADIGFKGQRGASAGQSNF